MTHCRSTKSRFKRLGLTLVELVIVIFIIGILIGMMLPAVRRVGGAAHRSTCMNNIRQLALALHNYESAHQEFPAAMGDQRLVELSSHPDTNRLSGMVLLLPFLEQNQLWSQISKPSTFGGVDFPAMGAAPWDMRYQPWTKQVPDFLCPASPRRKGADFGQTNYAFCIGDTARGIHNPNQIRGAFGAQLNRTFQDFADGTSNTIFLVEMGTSEGRRVNSNYAIRQPASFLDEPRKCLSLLDSTHPKEFDQRVGLGALGRGGCWADGAAGCSLVNTILPPNSPSCSITGNQAGDGFYSAGSFHVDGIFVVALADGSSHTINGDIDCGAVDASPLTESEMADGIRPSPFGVWGALGTIAGGEEYSLDDAF